MNGGWQDLMVERILLLVLPQVTCSFCTKNKVVVKLLNVSVCYLIGKLPNFKSTVDAKNDSCVDNYGLNVWCTYLDETFCFFK